MSLAPQMSLLAGQLPWYAGGPLLALCVVLVRLLFDDRLGVTGAVTEVVELALRGRRLGSWRTWFLAGLVLGGAVFATLGTGAPHSGHGWLAEAAGGAGLAACLLVLAGVLLGFGARTAGGCTSGNGLSGIASGSPSSIVATATFVASGVAVSLALEAVLR